MIDDVCFEWGVKRSCTVFKLKPIMRLKEIISYV